jgi:hypothetical protein
MLNFGCSLDPTMQADFEAICRVMEMAIYGAPLNCEGGFGGILWISPAF